MENSKDCDEDSGEIELDYFYDWKKKDQKSEKIYVRLRPEEKEIILSACRETEMSMSAFIRGASLEASEAVIKSYLARFPNSKLQ